VTKKRHGAIAPPQPTLLSDDSWRGISRGVRGRGRTTGFIKKSNLVENPPLPFVRCQSECSHRPSVSTDKCLLFPIKKSERFRSEWKRSGT
jgi:hypothetical protein